jgi:uncharacterized membrane protein
MLDLVAILKDTKLKRPNPLYQEDCFSVNLDIFSILFLYLTLYFLYG